MYVCAAMHSLTEKKRRRFLKWSKKSRFKFNRKRTIAARFKRIEVLIQHESNNEEKIKSKLKEREIERKNIYTFTLR